MKKQLWSQDLEQISKEMELIVQEKVRLFCIRSSAKGLKTLVAQKIAKSDKGPVLILNHPHEPTCGKPNCIYYYHRKNHSLRCFECVRVKKVGKYIGLLFPTSIFDIQRRNHPRVDTPAKSSATFSLQNKQRVHYSKVLNISLEGAKLRGEISTIVKKGSIITPLVLTLRQQINVQQEIVIHVPEAKVVRAIYDKNEEMTIELGVHFLLPANEQDLMTEYIELRNIEETIRSKSEGVSRP